MKVGHYIMTSFLLDLHKVYEALENQHNINNFNIFVCGTKSSWRAALNEFPSAEDFSRNMESFLEGDSAGPLRWLVFSLLFDDRSLMSLSHYSSFILAYFLIFSILPSSSMAAECC